MVLTSKSGNSGSAFVSSRRTAAGTPVSALFDWITRYMSRRGYCCSEKYTIPMGLSSARSPVFTLPTTPTIVQR